MWSSARAGMTAAKRPMRRGSPSRWSRSLDASRHGCTLTLRGTSSPAFACQARKAARPPPTSGQPRLKARRTPAVRSLPRTLPKLQHSGMQRLDGPRGLFLLPSALPTSTGFQAQRFFSVQRLSKRGDTCFVVNITLNRDPYHSRNMTVDLPRLCVAPHSRENSTTSRPPSAGTPSPRGWPIRPFPRPPASAHRMPAAGPGRRGRPGSWSRGG